MTLPLDALTSRRTSAPPVSLGLFITGTSTGVGKTWAAASLVRELRRSGVDAVCQCKTTVYQLSIYSNVTDEWHSLADER